HDERDRDHLPAKVEEIPPQLAMQHGHQLSSDGFARTALRVSERMRPSLRVITRSAIRAIGALWVMTAVVQSSSRLSLAITSSTRRHVVASSAPVGSSQSSISG